MALTNCKECKKEVSTSANLCPHCGVKNPGTKAKDVLVGAIFIVGIFALVAKCSSTSAPDSKTNAQPEISTAQREAQCKEDLQCWSQKAMIEVGGRCQRKIEKFAKYSVRWTDKTLESKFSRVAWLDKEKGTLRLIGDKVEFQNGFGAYRPHTYSCAVDPATKAVLDVAVQPGRL